MNDRDDTARRILADPVQRAMAQAQMVAILVTHPDAPRVIRQTQEAITRALTAARREAR